MKGFLILILAAILLLNNATPLFAAEQPVPTITVKVDGQTVSFPDAKPYIDENSRTLVPVRFISEALGANVTWNDEMKLVMIAKDVTRIALFTGQSQASVNTPEGGDKIITFDTKAIIKEDRTMVPLRFVSETLGAWVTWDGDTYTVTISSAGNPVVATPIVTAPDEREQIIKELQAYDYNIGLEGLNTSWRTNQEYIEKFGLDIEIVPKDQPYTGPLHASHIMEIAKGFIETEKNADYRTVDKGFYEKYRYYFTPEAYWNMRLSWIAGGIPPYEPVEYNTDEYIQLVIDDIKDYHIISKAEFITHKSLVYLSKEGISVRGRLKVTYYSVDDGYFEKYNSPKLEVGKEYYRDIEIRLAYYGKPDSLWEHANVTFSRIGHLTGYSEVK